MSVVDFEVVKAEFADSKQYKLKFQHSETTDLCKESTNLPVFQTKHFQSSIKESKSSEVPNFSVTVISVSDGKETRVDEVPVHLPSNFARDAVPFVVTFSKSNGSSLDGEVHIKYKFVKASLIQSLKSDQIYCVSIQAAHLNTLVETPFELKLTPKFLNSDEVYETVAINNKKPSEFINLSECMERVTEGVELIITDTVTGNMYRVNVTPQSPMVVTIPMKFGDPLVLTLQCVSHHEVKAKRVTGTVHTSFMREASISQTPGSTARKISLSPRRTTSFDQSAAAVGLLGTGQAIPSTKKTLLFLEDSTLSAKSTPNGAIIGGIQSAEQVNSLGEVISSRPVENHHEAYLAELSEQFLGKEGRGRYVGPSAGAYIVCNSKSEMLTSDLGKKTHKKQVLTINLGLMQIAQSGLTGPVRIRAKVVDIVFNTIADAEEPAAHAGPDDPDNPESTSGMAPSSGSGKGPAPAGEEKKTRHQQRALIAYIGMLEESSRELFNETGLIACTLEGKLFKPTAIQQSSSAVSAAASTMEGVGNEGEEACIAVKLYVSLVPSKSDAVVSEHVSDSESDQESGQVSDGEHTDSATDLKKLRKQQKNLNKQGSVLDYDRIDQEISQSFPTDKEFNVVTKETALPDELVGSSVLSLPGSRTSVVDLLAKVPRLDLWGDQDAKAKRPVGAFGEGLDGVQVVRAGAKKRQQAEQETANTGAAFAKLVSAELEKKQQLIETLLEDVKVRSEAIQVCGFDIRALREEQIRLTNKIKQMEADKETKAAEEAKADAITSEILKYPHLLHELDKPALIRNMHALREKVQRLDKDRAALQATLAQTKELVIQFAALKKEHHNLQEAHQQQTKYLQKMHGKINQVAAFQETIKTQEKIIHKMQSIVEAKMRSKNALPFLPKQPIPVPAPQDEMKFLPPDLPDFEALQAQKVNEEELFQARQEIQELNDKVQDLERQLYDAKLDAMNAQQDHSDHGSDSGSDAESEVPNLSSLKEAPTDAEKSQINDLKAANERIDQLEVESTSKSYRITALEAQLETSTRDYSREIARLRTKLFELEISAAMASDDRGSSAGDDNYMDMDMNFEELLNMQDPSQPTRRPSTMSRHNSARRGIADSTPASAAPTPSASQQKLPPMGLEAASSRPSSSVPSGSARAAVQALKQNPSTTENSPEKPLSGSKQASRRGSESQGAEMVGDAEKEHEVDADASEEPKAGEATAGVPSESASGSAKIAPVALSPKASTEKLPETAQEETEKDGEPTSSNHAESSEPRHVPKFRKASVAGIGPAGPQDPEAIDKEVEISFEIIDSDQASPRAEATIRTKKDNKIVMAMLKVTMHYHYDHVRKLSTFNIQRIRLHGFSESLLQDRFEPYLKLSYGQDKWKCVTNHAKSSGQEAEWVFNPSDGFFDKMFKVTDEEMAIEANSQFRCVVKKKNVKGHEDFECGEGSTVFTLNMFNSDSETEGK